MARTRNAAARVTGAHVPRLTAPAGTANLAFACDDVTGWCMGTSDFYAWATVNPILAPGHTAGMLWPNHTTKATAIQYMFPVPNGENLDQCGAHNYAVRKRAYVYSPSRTSTALNVNAGATGELTATGGANGGVEVVIEFDEYVDIRVYGQSFDGGWERLVFRQNVDEFFPGSGSIWSRVSDYGNGVAWENNNNAANSEFRFHRTKKVQFQYGKASNLNSTMSWDFLYFYGNVKRVRCPVRPSFVAGEKATTVEYGHALVTDAVPTFLPDFPATLAGWEYSADSGNTWNPAVANQAHTPSAAGVRRWRNVFTIPDGLRGSWRLTIAGDKYDGGGTAGTVWYDGAQVDTNTELYTARHWCPPIVVDPGNHVIEWREGVNVTGATAPKFVVDYALVLQACRAVYKVTRTDAANNVTTTYYDEDGAETVIAANEAWSAGSCKGDLL